MYKKLLSFVVVLASVLPMLTSCLGDDDYDVTYYDDTALTAFSVSSVNVYYTTEASDGSDSTYSESYSASDHVFYIDQYACEVYNPDSLPYGTDATKIVASMSTKNSGTAIIVYKDEEGADSLAYFSTSDSLDYTEPMELRVYNMMGTAYRTYTIRVNVHQQTGDEMAWNSVSASSLTAVGLRKLVNLDGTMYLFGLVGNETYVYKETSAGDWSQVGSGLDGDAYSNAIAFDGMLYTISDGNIVQSADGATWTTVASASDISRLLGAGAATLYALTDEGMAVSTDQGQTWTAQELDDDAQNLPAENFNMLCEKTTAGESTYSVLLIGTRDGVTKVWRKIEDYGDNAQEQPWAFYPEDEYNKLTLPALSSLQVIAYDDGFVATGGDFSVFYESKDQGVTWVENESYALPSTFDATADGYSMATNGNNEIYISGAGQSVTWHGVLARTQWADNQTIFTE